MVFQGKRCISYQVGGEFVYGMQILLWGIIDQLVENYGDELEYTQYMQLDVEDKKMAITLLEDSTHGTMVLPRNNFFCLPTGKIIVKIHDAGAYVIMDIVEMRVSENQ